MQLGHESSNRLKATVDQQLIDGAQLHGRRTENKDSRLMQLDLMIRGQSKVMRNLKKSILRATDCSSTVLITGESGTGKVSRISEKESLLDTGFRLRPSDDRYDDRCQ